MSEEEPIAGFQTTSTGYTASLNFTIRFNPYQMPAGHPFEGPGRACARCSWSVGAPQHAGYRPVDPRVPAVSLVAPAPGEVKRLYRACAKALHPDVAEEGKKAERTELMAELNRAYRANDVVRLRQVHAVLTKIGEIPTP